MCSVHVIPSGDVADIVEVVAIVQNSPSSGDHVTEFQNRDVDDIRYSTAV